MSLSPGQTIHKTVTLIGDSDTPTATLLHNGVVDGTVTPTVVAGAGSDQWLVTATLPGSGYAAGDSVELNVTATVGSTTSVFAFGPWWIDDVDNSSIVTIVNMTSSPINISLAGFNSTRLLARGLISASSSLLDLNGQIATLLAAGSIVVYTNPG
jgi:hypothetical protein